MNVLKRDGSIEPISLEKINKVIQWSIDGLKDLSLSDIEINAKVNFVDRIKTSDIHKALIESCVGLISIEKPDYQYAAAKLLNLSLRKEVWGGKNPPRLFDVIKAGVKIGIYTKSLLEDYSKEEINKLGEYIDHDRDYKFTYAGIKQLIDKYLIKNRETNELHETPQFAYMLIAMAGFASYKKNVRLAYVKKTYNYFSKFKINLPTPIMAGLRTNLKSFSSCCLIDIDDTKESLTSAATTISLATASRYGIGFNIGRIRSIGSTVRNGEVIHTGVIPFLKIYEASVKAWQQNSIRGGSATCNLPWWHYEIEDVVVLKNNAGTDDNRVRKLDYVVGMSKIIYDRFLKDENVTLFSPHEVKDLYEAFGNNVVFDELYKKYEKDPSVKLKKVISARKLLSLITKERVETGRIYIANIDNINEFGTWGESVKMLNLCLEVAQPLIFTQDFNDPNGEIGVCTLAAYNLLEIKSDEELEDVGDIMVRLLDEVIENQIYFNKAAENFAKKRRSLAIGVTNLAALLAKNGLKFSSKESPNFIDEWMEKIQFNLLKSSLNLAKEKGKCEKFGKTKYAEGILQFDSYKSNIDKFVTRKPSQDWKSLREEIKEHGLRNSTVTAMMPCESSSVIQCSTNGCEPIRSLITYKTSKNGKVPVLVPGIGEYHNNYELAFDLKDNIGLLNVNAAIQRWTCMSMSTNTYYNYSHYPNGTLPDTKVLKEMLYAYSIGLKALYYSNTDDGDKEQLLTPKEEDCAGGVCKL